MTLRYDTKLNGLWRASRKMLKIILSITKSEFSKSVPGKFIDKNADSANFSRTFLPVKLKTNFLWGNQIIGVWLTGITRLWFDGSIWLVALFLSFTYVKSATLYLIKYFLLIQPNYNTQTLFNRISSNLTIEWNRMNRMPSIPPKRMPRMESNNWTIEWILTTHQIV